MLKILLLSLYLITTSLQAEVLHSFYFNNDYEISNDMKVKESKIISNTILLPTVKTNSDIGISIKILELDFATNKTTLETFNPLNGFFNHKNTGKKREKVFIERHFKMKNKVMYVLHIDKNKNTISNYSFFKIENKKNLSSYLKNNTDIVIVGDIDKTQFKILNKNYTLDFTDKFIIKFKNRKIELSYYDHENQLFN